MSLPKAKRNQTLRFEDAPSVLTVPEAAVLLRRSAWCLYQRIKQEREEKERGVLSRNPLPVVRNGNRITIIKSELPVWLESEAALS